MITISTITRGEPFNYGSQRGLRSYHVRFSDGSTSTVGPGTIGNAASDADVRRYYANILAEKNAAAPRQNSRGARHSAKRNPRVRSETERTLLGWEKIPFHRVPTFDPGSRGAVRYARYQKQHHFARPPGGAVEVAYLPQRGWHWTGDFPLDGSPMQFHDVTSASEAFAAADAWAKAQGYLLTSPIGTDAAARIARPNPRGAQKRNPPVRVSTTRPATMTAAAINKEMDKLEVQRSENTRAFIAAGRGHERYSDTAGKKDPLSVASHAIQDRQIELFNEVEQRYGRRGVRLPSRGYGPRENPASGASGAVYLVVLQDLPAPPDDVNPHTGAKAWRYRHDAGPYADMATAVAKAQREADEYVDAQKGGWKYRAAVYKVVGGSPEDKPVKIVLPSTAREAARAKAVKADELRKYGKWEELAKLERWPGRQKRWPKETA